MNFQKKSRAVFGKTWLDFAMASGLVNIKLLFFFFSDHTHHFHHEFMFSSGSKVSKFSNIVHPKKNANCLDDNSLSKEQLRTYTLATILGRQNETEN